MNIFEFADVCNLVIEVRYFPNQNRRWSAHFEGAEVMERGVLISHFEDGRTPDEAVQNYWQSMKGKKFAVNAYSKELRREYTVPR